MVFVIAEAGDNHNGSLLLAKKLVDVAKESKADAVKFQIFKTENLVTKYAAKAQYQKEFNKDAESQFEMLKKLELSFSEFEELYLYCKKVGIIFLSTAFDFESIDFLSNFDVPFWKVPSGEITNLPYLIQISKFNKPILLSTGMCEVFEIEQAVSAIRRYSSNEIIILHCNTEYPTPFEDVNLLAMRTLGEKFNCRFGYSDHTTGISVPIAAVALGASVIEKHFTLDKNMQGPDHKASLDPKELKIMVRSIREIEVSLGNRKKFVTKSEEKNILIARKSIVAKKNISKGEIFTEKNLTVKRPAIGISPMKWFEILGKESNRYYKKDEAIEIIKN
ncbi:MAG: N-acetylneuraminate synthase [Oscillospiraceae bacterium]|jgi:N,N'-diacetyllegionaminate synthase|nr:N-acetylneuraminate synthase [Oscillospiraceae bacterium]